MTPSFYPKTKLKHVNTLSVLQILTKLAPKTFFRVKFGELEHEFPGIMAKNVGHSTLSKILDHQRRKLEVRRDAVMMIFSRIIFGKIFPNHFQHLGGVGIKFWPIHILNQPKKGIFSYQIS